MRQTAILLTLFLTAVTTAVLYSQAPEEKPSAEEISKKIDELASQMPRLPSSTAEQSRKQMELHSEFEVQIVATEPLIRDPGAIDIDEDGKMYVCELPEYNAYAAKEDPGQKGAIKQLLDTDGDGRYDKATTFLSDIPYPTAVLCWDGGVFIGAAPNIHYAKDTDGDGVADESKVVLSGFGSDLAGEAHLNSFRWGPDNRIHLSTNLSGGDVKPHEGGKEAISVRGRGIIFDPRNPADFELTSGGGQHGMSMDNWGRKFVCQNSVPAETLMYDDRYLARNPVMQATKAAVSIAPDGKFTHLFRISKGEPWRELRTMLRRTKQFRGSDEGGKPFGFFTGATGITIYRGDAWPKSMHGNLIVGDVANNLVYRAFFKTDGLNLIAERADEGQEFLASKDLWFRPVQFMNAPDGTLYVLDISRELIEGAAFLPPEFINHLDPVSGNDQGRIFRIAPKGFDSALTLNLSQWNTPELVDLLDHSNGWHRDTASRLIYTRQDLSAVAKLRQLVQQGKTANGRFLALYSLQGLGALDETSVLRCLQDDEPIIRWHALKTAESLCNQSPAILHTMNQMVSDPDIRVRYQLAFSIGQALAPSRNSTLTTLARKDIGNAWMRLAILSSLSKDADKVLSALATDDDFPSQPDGLAFLKDVCSQIGIRNRPHEISTVIGLMEKHTDLASPFLEALVSKVQGEQREQLLAFTSGKTADALMKLVTSAVETAQNVELEPATRIQAIENLQLAEFRQVSELLDQLLDVRQPFEIKATAIDTLGEFTQQEVALILLSRWSMLGPTLRMRAAEVLLSRNVWTHELLQAVEQGRVRRGELDPARIVLLKTHPDETIAKRVNNLFANSGNAARATVLKDYQSALDSEGNSEQGKALFKKHCSACHRLENVGNQVGADLNGIRNRGMDAVLLNILDPNREVKPKYLTYVIVDFDGRSITGMIAEESANSITVQKPDGTSTTVLRSEIDLLKSTGLSFMPEGLEKQINKQQMADLLAYLNSLQ